MGFRRAHEPRKAQTGQTTLFLHFLEIVQDLIEVESFCIYVFSERGLLVMSSWNVMSMIQRAACR